MSYLLFLYLTKIWNKYCTMGGKMFSQGDKIKGTDVLGALYRGVYQIF